MKIFLLAVLLASISGCAWISLDRYYENDGSNYQWQSKFRAGKTSTKVMGYPDTQIHTFYHPSFKLTVDISYQDIGAVTPFFIPIIPTPWDSSKNLVVKANIYTDTETEIDLSKWFITTGGVSYAPEKVFIVGQDKAIVGKTMLTKGSYIYVTYQLKVAAIDSLLIDFGTFLKGQESIKVPILQLIKTKGTWHYEVLNV